jgi:hypothetical protein
LQYRLPLNVSSLKLATFFAKLEQEKRNLGIESYGFAAPSLQQVTKRCGFNVYSIFQIFLTVAPHKELVLKKQPNIFVRIRRALFSRGRSQNYIAANAVGMEPETEIDSKELVKDEEEENGEDLIHPPMSFIRSNCPLRIQQVRALFIKRLNTSRRNLVSMFFELLLPIIVLLVAEVYAKTQIENRDFKFMVTQRPLSLTQALYGNSTKFYVGLWDNSSIPAPLNSLLQKPGPGLRCVNGLHLKSHSG